MSPTWRHHERRHRTARHARTLGSAANPKKNLDSGLARTRPRLTVRNESSSDTSHLSPLRVTTIRHAGPYVPFMANQTVTSLPRPVDYVPDTASLRITSQTFPSSVRERRPRDWVQESLFSLHVVPDRFTAAKFSDCEVQPHLEPTLSTQHLDPGLDPLDLTVATVRARHVAFSAPYALPEIFVDHSLDLSFFLPLVLRSGAERAAAQLDPAGWFDPTSIVVLDDVQVAPNWGDLGLESLVMLRAVTATDPYCPLVACRSIPQSAVGSVGVEYHRSLLLLTGFHQAEFDAPDIFIMEGTGALIQQRLQALIEIQLEGLQALQALPTKEPWL